MNNKIFKYLRRTIGWYNNQNAVLLLFLIVMASYAGVYLWGGEEQYFTFAKHFMDPNWIPNSKTISSPAGGNLAFQVLAGFLLKFISFKSLAFWGRAVNFLLLSIPLAKLLKHFRFSNIDISFLILLIFLPHQSFFASEWIFQNLEEKSIAYIFVLFSYYYLFRDKLIPSVIFTIPATYFHFLVGGWNIVIVLLYFLIRQKSLKKLWLPVIGYFVFMFPFILYLYKLYIVNNPSMINGLNTNWIYAYERVPHHIAPFRSLKEFVKIHLDGIVICFAFYMLCIFYFRRIKNSLIQKINLVNIILFSVQYIFLIISIFDREGTVLKLYPFRTNTLSALFIFTEIFFIIKFYAYPWIINKSVPLKRYTLRIYAWKFRWKIYVLVNVIMLALIIGFFIGETSQTLHGKNKDQPLPSADMNKLIDYIKTNTDKQDVFMLLDNDYPLSFTRLTERDRFVVWKFTPTKSKAIYDWYIREKWKELLRADMNNIELFTHFYNVDYIISSRKQENSLLHKVISYGNVTMYEIAKNQL